MPKNKRSESEKLSEIIIEGILKRKGLDVVRMDLTKLPNSVCNYFVICHGTSKVQVEAIAESVLEEAFENDASKPWHKEGFENAEWILLDYVDIVVHIFLEDMRTFYNLENLWADAKIKRYNEN